MLFETIKKLGQCELFIKEEIIYSNLSDCVFNEDKLDKKLFYLNENNDVIIKSGLKVKGEINSFSGNGWLEITFEDGEYLDIAFDKDEDYDKHFEII